MNSITKTMPCRALWMARLIPWASLFYHLTIFFIAIVGFSFSSNFSVNFPRACHGVLSCVILKEPFFWGGGARGLENRMHIESPQSILPKRLVTWSTLHARCLPWCTGYWHLFDSAAPRCCHVADFCQLILPIIASLGSVTLHLLLSLNLPRPSQAPFIFEYNCISRIHSAIKSWTFIFINNLWSQSTSAETAMR